MASGQTVLVAEDHETNRQVARLLLERLGFSVEFVHDGAKAVARRKTDDGFTAILMDVQMPVMDGMTATREIRAWEALQGARRIPIFGLSAHALAEEKKKGMDAGMDLFLTKPVSLAHLRQALLTCVEGHADDADNETPAAVPPVRSDAPEVISDEGVSMLLGLGDAEVVEQIVTSFVSDIRARVAKLAAASEQGNTNDVVFVCHAAKGASRSLGLMPPGDAFAALESGAKEDETLPEATHIAALGAHVERAVGSLDAVLERCRRA